MSSFIYRHRRRTLCRTVKCVTFPATQTGAPPPLQLPRCITSRLSALSRSHLPVFHISPITLFLSFYIFFVFSIFSFFSFGGGFFPAFPPRLLFLYPYQSLWPPHMSLLYISFISLSSPEPQHSLPSFTSSVLPPPLSSTVPPPRRRFPPPANVRSTLFLPQDHALLTLSIISLTAALAALPPPLVPLS